MSDEAATGPETETPPVTPAPSPQALVKRSAPVPVLAGRPPRGIIPQSLAETAKLAAVMFESGLAPRDLKNVQAVAVAIMTGLELGLPPMQAMKSIAVINGKPVIYGDAGVALIVSSGLLTQRKEWFDGTPYEDDFTFHILVAREGFEQQVDFSVADAKRAKLWEKRGSNGQDTPWITYPKRMMTWRGRSYAFRDLFADVLCGLRFKEEAEWDEIDAFATPTTSGLANRLPGPSGNGFSEEHITREMGDGDQREEADRESNGTAEGEAGSGDRTEGGEGEDGDVSEKGGADSVPATDLNDDERELIAGIASDLATVTDEKGLQAVRNANAPTIELTSKACQAAAQAKYDAKQAKIDKAGKRKRK